MHKKWPILTVLRMFFPPVFEELYHTQDINDIKASYGKMYINHLLPETLMTKESRVGFCRHNGNEDTRNIFLNLLRFSKFSKTFVESPNCKVPWKDTLLLFF